MLYRYSQKGWFFVCGIDLAPPFLPALKRGSPGGRKDEIGIALDQQGQLGQVKEAIASSPI
jgi:hypothetical protein